MRFFFTITKNIVTSKSEWTLYDMRIEKMISALLDVMHYHNL